MKYRPEVLLAAVVTFQEGKLSCTQYLIKVMIDHEHKKDLEVSRFRKMQVNKVGLSVFETLPVSPVKQC